MKTRQIQTKFTFLSHNRRKTIESYHKVKAVRDWKLIGVGSGWGARDMGTADGPKVLLEHIPDYFRNFPKILSYWHKSPLITAGVGPLSSIEARIHGDHVYEMTSQLSEQAKDAILEGKIPLVLGGDHSIAIGTWSGVKAAIGPEDMGLIWIDAHLDAHIPETSPSLNIHGMPVAVLLGQGESRFTNLCGLSPKLKPENICLIGIRSFEEGEENLLKQMGVRIYYMKEVQDRGFQVVFTEACQKLSNLKFGVSIDVDGFDPLEAPGTGTPESIGLTYNEVKSAMHNLVQNPNFIALEITEFNPHRDTEDMTVNLVWNLARTISGDLS
jgi:arginase